MIPKWLPGWLRDALAHPVMSVPDAGKAVFGVPRGSAYALAKRGVMPTIRGGRRMAVPTAWVREQLRLDGGRND
jgi:hypothetical protein